MKALLYYMMAFIPDWCKKAHIPDRSVNILLDVLAGRTYEKIATEYNLSKTRIRQIYMRTSFVLVTFLEKSAREPTEHYKKRYNELHTKWLDLHSRYQDLLKLVAENNKKNLPVAPEIKLSELRRNFIISVRAYNALKAADVRTLGDLIALSKSDIMKYRSFGERSYEEIVKLLESYGLQLEKE